MSQRLKLLVIAPLAEPQPAPGIILEQGRHGIIPRMWMRRPASADADGLEEGGVDGGKYTILMRWHPNYVGILHDLKGVYIKSVCLFVILM